MIRSMTAFARSEYRGELGELTIELRSINHRFLELNPRLSEELRLFEPLLRQELTRAISRGKIDVTLKYTAPMQAQDQLILNEPLAIAVARLSHDLDKLHYNPAPVSSLQLLQWPGVLQSRPLDREALQQQLQQQLQQTIQSFITSREAEGERLQQVILQRCGQIQAILTTVTERLPQVLSAARARLQQRVEELAQQPLDSGRLEQEMALVAQRLDVDEELQRLQSHLTELMENLQRPEPIGRRLDFLLQELNREANTLGSKSADLQTTQAAVELKVLLEQIREQIQNIE